MKKIAFMSALLITGMAQAASGTSDFAIISKIAKGEMPVKENGVYIVPKHDDIDEVMQKGVAVQKRNLKKVVNTNKLFALDSVVGRMDNGDYTLKEVYKYDENSNSKEANFYSWDTATSEWSMTKYVLLDWDDNNLCTLEETLYYSEWGDTGQRNVMVYDEDGMNTQTDIFMFYDGEWVASQRSIYQYDQYGWPTEEIIQLPGETVGTWQNVLKNVAAWTPTGLRTLAEQYTWNDNKWVPTGSRIIYEFDSEGRITLSLHYVWSGTEWQNYIKIIQEWGIYGITYQSYELWNEENQNWFGNMYMPSLYSTIEYDSDGRSILERAYSYSFEKAAWIEHHRQVSNYTDLDNGYVRELQYLYDMTNEPMLISELIKECNAVGNVTYWMQSVRDENNDCMTPFEEKIFIYDESGILVALGEEYSYTDGTRIANYREQHIYDEDNYPEESWYQMGTYFMTGEGNPEEWMNYSYFIYKYENGEETSRIAYRWQDDEYVSFWGQQTDFNFKIPATDCLYWYDMETGIDYQVTATRRFIPDGKDWRYEEGIWYYSDLTSTDIKEIETSILKIYPNPVTDYVNIEGTNGHTANIYDIKGSFMLSSDCNRINVSQLTPGIYILNVAGKTVKLIKK